MTQHIEHTIASLYPKVAVSVVECTAVIGVAKTAGSVQSRIDVALHFATRIVIAYEGNDGNAKVLRFAFDTPIRNRTFAPAFAVGALGRLIQLAAKNSQGIVVSHNPILVGELESDEICVPIRLEKKDGATVLQDGNLLSQYGWKWPSR